MLYQILFLTYIKYIIIETIEQSGEKIYTKLKNKIKK